ncbi:hypothetical protein EJ419_03415 [Alloscardovia theropitheci]|uniref:DNA 3'-5' helicase n=1 Tax=Alloscardovia theropitheci TaxID=2496842 RepID=A0A4V2MUC0_9BIFI|nr:PD-(D/E)XK nuclease family protein [Alloscardovia theropitheci]TCD54429.1 hypothetical protein EJ419_03415 [Alloscardovia theropitheci]
MSQTMVKTMKITSDVALERIAESFMHNDANDRAFLVTGSPRSGKSWLARRLAVKAAQEFGSHSVTLVVTNRLVADEANREILRELTISGQRRLATTLSAVAFRIIDERQMLAGDPAPRLLNGAEQTAVLRTIFDRHVMHAQTGDLCDTCMLLRQYFVGSHADSQLTDTLSLFESYITPVFTLQLRDILARMNELGASHRMEAQIIDVLTTHDDNPQQRLQREYTTLQIKLAYALRLEYAQEIDEQFSRELRFDSSRLLREAALTFNSGQAQEIGLNVPKVLIVDDAQELTLAGIFLVHELYKAGTRVIFIGNPDESVLGFRGAYGEFLWNRAPQKEDNTSPFLSKDFGCFDACEVNLTSRYSWDHLTYNDVIAARVALNIPSEYPTDIPLPYRAQKFPTLDGDSNDTDNLKSLMSSHDDAMKSESVDAHIFHSAREESDFVINSIMNERITHQRSWNDTAIIVHDNSVARALGVRLQNEGIPVRFSAISKPLSEDPVTLGLFAAIQLGMINPDEISTSNVSSSDELLARVNASLQQYTMSPFAMDEQERSLNMRHIDAALNAITTIIQAWRSNAVQLKESAAVQEANQESEQEENDTYNFDALYNAWLSVLEKFGVSQDDYPLNVSALKTIALLNIANQTNSILDLMGSMRAEYRHDVEMLRKFILMSETARRSLKGEHSGGEQSRSAQSGSGQDTDIISVLWAVWSSSHVAEKWQSKALDFSDFAQRLRYNEWLDNVMRLFDYADQKNTAMSVPEFISHVMQLEISADSLAHLAPIDEAVTVTTPASAAGQTWRDVWIVGMQQGTWPNLAARNTMFGADNLADIIMHGSSTHDAHEQMMSVLHSEKRSFLVALTRASRTTHVSAVWDESTTPSDFLFEYAHELFPRVDKLDQVDFTSVPIISMEDASLQEEMGSLELTSISDIIRQARVTLSQEISHTRPTPECLDAMSALDYLRTAGYDEANPAKWGFIGYLSGDERKSAIQESKTLQTGKDNPVRLSPSSVEKIWGCAICYRLENQLSGPQANTAATSFGTLIHSVAQWASEEMFFDSADFYEDAVKSLGSSAKVVETVAQEMKAHYDELRTAPDVDANMNEYLREVKNDQLASDILHNIAYYFVMSHEAKIASNDKFHPPYLPLTSAQTEVEFDAYITMEDIRYAYNSIPGRIALTRNEFGELMTRLVEGMPLGYNYDTVVNLHGFIDRVEKHGGATYIVDFKTGNKAHNLSSQFNDLQLISYQLGLTFHNTQHDTDEQRKKVLSKAPMIDMSVLFDVKHENVPATSRGEGFAKYQPAVFENGHLGCSDATRSYMKSHVNVQQDFTFDPHSFVGVEGMREEAIERILEEFAGRDHDRTLYTLSLIARVFYAAAVMRSENLVVHTVHLSHDTKYCAYKDVCSACAHRNNSVMEEWL